MAEIKNYTLNFSSGPVALRASLTCAARKLAFTGSSAWRLWLRPGTGTGRLLANG